MQCSSRPHQFSWRTGDEVGINRVKDISYIHGWAAVSLQTRQTSHSSSLLTCEMQSSTGNGSARESHAKCSPCTQVVCGSLAWESDTAMTQRERQTPPCWGKWGRSLLSEGHELCMALYSCSEGAGAGRWCQVCTCTTAGRQELWYLLPSLQLNVCLFLPQPIFW